MLDRALALCGAAFGVLWTYDGERIHAAAFRGTTQKFVEFITRHLRGGDLARQRRVALGGSLRRRRDRSSLVPPFAQQRSPDALDAGDDNPRRRRDSPIRGLA
jgi:hypothetical protein